MRGQDQVPGPTYFWPVKPPTCEDLDVIAHTIARRVSRFLEKAGYLVRDAESEYLDLMQDEEDAMGAIVGASTDASDRTYRLAFGPNAGRKALTLQTVPVRTEQRKGDDLVSQQAGFSLHAGIACKSHQRKKLERPAGVPLCRYITRPAIAERRLSLANNGNVVIALKTPYDDGTSHVVLSPIEFMGRLAALVPRPRANLTRFHGVFSRGGLPPHSKLREYVVSQKPLEEQESPKPKAYSRPGRVRMGATAQARVWY
jgi:hypothetical protein